MIGSMSEVESLRQSVAGCDIVDVAQPEYKLHACMPQVSQLHVFTALSNISSLEYDNLLCLGTETEFLTTTTMTSGLQEFILFQTRIWHGKWSIGVKTHDQTCVLLVDL